MVIAKSVTPTEVSVSHANARLNLHGRMLLVRRVRVEGRPVAHVAKEQGGQGSVSGGPVIHPPSMCVN